MPQYLLGVDVGTQGSKGVLVTTEGRVVANHAVEHGTSQPHPGWFEHDADEVWWGDFVRLSQALLAQSAVDPAQIVGVGASALGPNMLPVDAQGRPLRPGVLYGIDTRAQVEIAAMNRELGLDGPDVPRVDKLKAQNVAPKVLWLRDHEPERWQRTHKILGAPGYIVHRLTGAFCMDAGNAGSLNPFYDPVRQTWDPAMCARFGVPVDVLPEVRQATDVVGTVTPEAAAATGLRAGTPVICGMGDAGAEYLSTGIAEDGEGALLYGTTMCFTVLTSERHTHPLLGSSRSVVSGFYGIGGGMATSAALTRWFRDNFGRDEVEAEQRLGISAYQLLGLEAGRVPAGSEGLVVLPYFSGERSPIHDAEARGLIIGLTIQHTRCHLYRALLEGVAYGLRHHLDLMADVGVRARRMIAAGGGSQSELWTQIVSDVTGVSQECIDRPMGPALADAFMAGIGVGLFRDFRPLRERWVRIGRVVHPQPAAQAIYDRYYQVYRRLYEHNVEEMHELSRLATMPPTEVVAAR